MPKPADLPYPLLFVDSTERETVNLALLTGGQTIRLAAEERAQAIPQLIGQLLDKAGVELAELQGLAVANQAGSLTGTRIGVTVTNTLGWLRALPIIEVPAENFEAGLKLLEIGRGVAERQAKVAGEVVH